MKVTVKYEDLQNTLGYINTVLSDKSVEDKFRNVIFLVTPNEVKVVGYNQFTFSRIALDEENITIEEVEGEWEFQIKASELNKILSSFSNMYRTEVKTLSFAPDGVKIKVTVHEVPKNEEDSNLEQDSDFYLESAPILKNILKEIHMDFPESVETAISGDLFLYLDSLFPIMNNDAANKMESKLNFDEDYVFVITSTMSAFMVNNLPDAFKKLTISYSSANFLKKLCENSEMFGVARVEKYLCIQSENIEAFMRFQAVKVNKAMYVQKRDKTLGVVLDRLYLKDVLKRMGNIDINGKLSITEDGMLQAVNSNFQQVIPLNKVKENTAGINFNIAVSILEKAIIGKDDSFPEELFMYFVPTQRGYLLYLSDKSGAWFSNTQVIKAKE